MMPIFSDDEVEVKLPDWVTPSRIAGIKYPNNPKTAAERDDDVWKKALKDKRDRLKETLEEACRSGDLEYEGESAHWVNEIKPNSQPKYPPPGFHIEPQTYKKLIPSTIKIHNTKFKKFVDGDKKWFPVDFWQVLINLWIDKELVAEAIEDNGESNQTEPKPLNNPRNDTEFSGLLSIPKKTDDWFNVIDDMTSNFHAKLSKMPNETQAWVALWSNPPEGYEITTGKSSGEDCLIMPGANPLSKSAFLKRWKSYTNKA